MSENSQDSLYLFKPAQNLGQPAVFPPLAQGKIPASLQFIIPGFKLGKRDKKHVTQLAHKCGIDLWGIDMHPAENRRTKEPATLVTFAFYVTPTNSEDENHQFTQSMSRLLIERFLGLLSFFVGIKLSAVDIQVTTREKNGHYSKILPVSARTSTPCIITEFPADLEGIAPTDDVFSALFWLRRGLSERDPIENFSALMVCLQIMARHIVKQKRSTTALMRELIVSRLGATPDLFKRL